LVAQQKLLRVFKLIRTLNRKPGKTVAQLARLLETSERSVYRYLHLLEEVGYLLDKDAYERYYLFEPENEKVKPSFEAEEADLIRDLVTSAAAHHPLKDAILKKLYLNSELIPLADNLLKTQVAQLVHRLGEAIRARKQAVLHHYHSPRSNSITDRLVEPMDFTNFALACLEKWSCKSQRRCGRICEKGVQNFPFNVCALCKLLYLGHPTVNKGLKNRIISISYSLYLIHYNKV
jgi:predicted DNA-binding transcriptional regulator YafY